MTFQQVKHRVYKVNSQLIEKGYTWKEIREFWSELILEFRIKDQLKNLN